MPCYVKIILANYLTFFSVVVHSQSCSLHSTPLNMTCELFLTSFLSYYNETCLNGVRNLVFNLVCGSYKPTVLYGYKCGIKSQAPIPVGLVCEPTRAGRTGVCYPPGAGRHQWSLFWLVTHLWLHWPRPELVSRCLQPLENGRNTNRHIWFFVKMGHIWLLVLSCCLCPLV